MATEWYYQIMNDVVGPLSGRQLLDKVRAGQVKEDTLVRKDDSQWVPARQVNGLMDAVEQSRTQRVCPYCGQRDDRYRSDRRDRDNDRYRADRRDRDDDRQNRNEDEWYWENRRYQEGQYRPMGTYDWQTPRKQRRFDGQSYDTGTRWDQQYGTTHQTNRKSR